MAAGIAICHDCEKVMELGGEIGLQPSSCLRCNAPVHFRKPHSVSKTWALLISSIILYLPANILPIMEVTFLGDTTASTIMDGIVYFFQHGSYGIGVIIFTASILVPSFKIIGMMLILFSLQFRWIRWLRHKTLMYRFIHFIGRWSMLDIFVVALLCVLVKFSNFSSIAAAPAMTYFAGVVVLTMLAANTLDTRLLWDIYENNAD